MERPRMSPTTLTRTLTASSTVTSMVTSIVSSTLRATLRMSPTWQLSLMARVIPGLWSGHHLGSWRPPGKSWSQRGK